MSVIIEVPLSAGLIFATRTAMAAYVTGNKGAVIDGFQDLFSRIAPLIIEKIQSGELAVKRDPYRETGPDLNRFYLSVLPECPFVLTFNAPNPRNSSANYSAGYWVHKEHGGYAFNLHYNDEADPGDTSGHQSAFMGVVGHLFGSRSE